LFRLRCCCFDGKGSKKKKDDKEDGTHTEQKSELLKKDKKSPHAFLNEWGQT